ncbi:cytochrome P450 family protein [Mycobacteroides abscessus subsp. bolletii 1513]|uniref:Cytochrome P450 family protein n=1 Tax=Mycobacteroides abscessus subsp. bolletii 1513 TaxID=1299321 RepID=X8DSN0_9MYCO|nr:cytochrome P450 family protein [Mycobacteroides abscessus subsp. bolletii 1513]
MGFGRGLVTDLNEGLWNRNRRLVQPIFAKRQVDLFAPQMAEAAARTVSRWDELYAEGKPVDITAEMNYLTMDIVAQTMFGIDLSGDMAERMRIYFARLLKLFGVGFIVGAAPPLRWVVDKLAAHGPHELSSHTPRLAIRALRIGASVAAPRTMKGLRWVERTIDQLIADHRSGRIARQDNLLALLMAAEDPETGAKYTDLEIRDELMTFLGRDSRPPLPRSLGPGICCPAIPMPAPSWGKKLIGYWAGGNLRLRTSTISPGPRRY